MRHGIGSRAFEGSCVDELPAVARATVARIEALLDEARALPGLAASADESAYSLRETERSYLPDTLRAYFAIPPSQRDDATRALVEKQLLQLERATATHLAAYAQTQRLALQSNGAFFDARFGTIESLAPAPIAADTEPSNDGESSSRAMIGRFFETLAPAAATDPTALLVRAAERFMTLVPALTTVKRGLFGGAPQAVTIDVPSGNAVLRYALASSRTGIATSVTQFVRGIALRTEACDAETWFAGLAHDLGEYVERDRATRGRLAAFFGI